MGSIRGARRALNFWIQAELYMGYDAHTAVAEYTVWFYPALSARIS